MWWPFRKKKSIKLDILPKTYGEKIKTDTGYIVRVYFWQDGEYQYEQTTESTKIQADFSYNQLLRKHQR